MLYAAAVGDLRMAGSSTWLSRQKRALLDIMDQAAGSSQHHALALAGFQLASLLPTMAASKEPVLQEDTPSAMLRGLQQARASHLCCRKVLPRQWTLILERRWATAKQLRRWLEQLQQQGDAWAPMDAAALAAVYDDGLERALRICSAPTAALECSGCGRPAPHLKRCGACKQAQYCSAQCQRSHWPAHKAACRAHQASGGS